MPTGWTVLKDGVQVAPVVFSEEYPAHTWLLKHQSKAVSSAIRDEGYSIEEIDRDCSERATYVTREVTLWVAGDQQVAGRAITSYRERGGEYGLWRYVTGLLEQPKPYSGAWHVAQELAPNDYRRIRWDHVWAEISDIEG